MSPASKGEFIGGHGDITHPADSRCKLSLFPGLTNNQGPQHRQDSASHGGGGA